MRVVHPGRWCLIALLGLVTGGCGEERERRLDGEWRVRFTLEKPYSDPMWKGVPLTDTLTGTIVVHPGFPSFPDWGEVPEEMQPYAIGRYFVDFGPFFGDPAQPDSARPRADLESGSNSPLEVMAHRTGADSVFFALSPHVFDAGFSLRGVIRNDTAVGTWVQHAYCCGARGRFRMWRVTPTIVMDSALHHAREGRSRRTRSSGSAKAKA